METLYSLERLAALYQQASYWMRRYHLVRYLTYLLVTAAIGLGLLTYFTLTRSGPFGSGSRNVVLLLNLDLGILLLLGVLVARRLVELWSARRRGLAGSRLHVRLVGLFSLLTVTPSIVLAVFSALFFNTGIQAWFDKRVQTALSQSSAVAEAYLEEHKKVIRVDVQAMAHDIANNLGILIYDSALFNDFVDRQVDLRSLSEAIIFDSSPKVYARSRLSFALELEGMGEFDMRMAREGIVIKAREKNDCVHALVQITPNLDMYLLIGRFVDPQVLQRIAQTENAVSEYHQLNNELNELEIRFVLIFVIVALLLLFVAVWFGLSYATHLARPIIHLIQATERVRSGDLSVRVQEKSNHIDLELLNRAFNRMTDQLEKQTSELVEANQQVDQRRQFIEAVLAGVSAGVIGLDKKLKIIHLNRTAAELIERDPEKVIGKSLFKVAPDFKSLFEGLDQKTGVFWQRQLEVMRRGFIRTLLVRIVAEKSNKGDEGFVVTFDDISELVSVQRQAAWSDVARRVAHEIKNPLTPIQLSAERLKGRYLKEVKSDPEGFAKYVDTIIRQVGYLERMIREFSSFARMPSAVIRPHDLNELCQQAIFLQREAHSSISFEFNCDMSKMMMNCDATQVTQVLINLLQNAFDSVSSRLKRKSDKSGKILLCLRVDPDGIIITIDDNGEGFPKEHRESLIEPYVTNKGKGTGLGLAIVKRIMEDHGGSLLLKDRPGGGARVYVRFPANAQVQDRAN